MQTKFIYAPRLVSSNIPLTTPSPGVRGTKLETIKNWTISTYKCSRQSLYEKLGT